VQIKEGQYGLLAVGNTGTQLLEFERVQFTLPVPETDYDEIAGLLNGWAAKWNIKGIKIDSKFDADTALTTDQISEFNSYVFNQALGTLLLEAKEEVLRNKLKEDKDNSHMSSGLKRLMNTLDLKDKSGGQEEVFIGNLLFKACAAVGQAKKMTIVPSYELKKGNSESKDLLGDIARASQIRIRQIILKDRWWQEDNSALLAFGRRRASGGFIATVTYQIRFIRSS
jgi:ATP-binding cassette subfamily C protein